MAAATPLTIGKLKLPPKKPLTMALRESKRGLPQTPGDETLEGWADAVVVHTQTDAGEPDWYEGLRNVAPQLPNRAASSVRGVALLRLPAGTFALTFGPAGHLLIDPDCLVRGWGRRVALNLIYDQSGKLRGVGDALRRGRRTRLGAGITTDVASAESVTLDTLGFDRAQEVLSRVTVAAAEPDIARHVTGDDFLTVRWKKSIEEVPNLLKRMEALYQRTSYKAHFGFIDDLREVRDAKTKAEVWQRVAKHISKPPTKAGATHLSIMPPASFDLAGARFAILGLTGKPKRGGHPIAECDLDHYRTLLRHEKLLGKLSPDELKKHRLRCVGGDGITEEDHFVRACLEGVVAKGAKRYAILDGSIYEVAKGFLKELDDFVDALDRDAVSSLALPTFSSVPKRKALKNGMPTLVRDEHAYNIAVATPPGRLLLDRKNVVTVSGYTSPVEACDVLTEQGLFIHVKRGVSANGVSHLLAQASVSAELLVDSREFRKALRSKIRACCKIAGVRPTKFVSWVPLSLSDGRNHTVVLAIVDKVFKPSSGSTTAAPLSSQIPFFSKLNMRAAVVRLQRRSFQVKLACISA